MTHEMGTRPESRFRRILSARYIAIALVVLLVAGGGLYLLGAFSGLGETAPDVVQQTMADNAPAEPDKLAPQPERPKFPLMKLEAQFAGPFQDTLIQRWRDPIDGRVCYLYIPVRVKHEPAPEGGVVDYGANNIGSISCTGPDPAKP